MGERRIRLIDCSAGALWVLTVWMMMHGGFHETTPWHAWGVTAGQVALAVTMRAFATCSTTRIVRAVHHKNLDDLLHD